MSTSAENSNNSDGKKPLEPIDAVSTSSLLPKDAGGAGDDNDEESPIHDNYGAFVPVADEFLPLGGDDSEGWPDGHVTFAELEDEVDENRPPATTLIYLCALCSSLTSVLLGYGKHRLQSMTLST